MAKVQYVLMKHFSGKVTNRFPRMNFPSIMRGDRYTFGVPLICSNIALIGISAIPAPPPTIAKPELQPEPEPVVAVRPYTWLLDAGYLYQTDPAHYLFFRGGIEYPLNKNWSVLGLIGLAPKIDGNEGENSLSGGCIVQL